jgi:hypothetical protein
MGVEVGRTYWTGRVLSGSGECVVDIKARLGQREANGEEKKRGDADYAPGTAAVGCRYAERRRAQKGWRDEAFKSKKARLCCVY